MLKLSVFALAVIFVIGCGSSIPPIDSSIFSSNQQIYFVLDDKELARVNVKTGTEQIVKTYGDNITSLSWSPDGRYLAFLQPGKWDYLVHVLDTEKDTLSKTPVRVKTDWEELDIHWLDDNKTFFFADFKGVWRCRVGGESARIIDQPSITKLRTIPGTQKLIFSAFCNIFVHDLSSGKNQSYATAIKTVIDSSGGFIHQMDYSAKTGNIAFAQDKNAFVFSPAQKSLKQIYKSDKRIHWLSWKLDGKGVVLLSGLSTKWYKMETVTFNWQDTLSWRSFTPVEREIAERSVNRYISGPFDSHSNNKNRIRKRFSGDFSIYSIDIGDSSAVRLYSKREDALTIFPHLTPDGKYVVLSTNSPNSSRNVYLLSIDEGKTFRVNRKGICKYPVWKP